MSVRYSEDFKKEVVKAYMAGDKSIHQLAVEFNVAKGSVSKWANEYRKECLYTADTTSESNDAKEIRRLNQLLNEKDKENSFLKKAAAFFAKEIDWWYIDSLTITKNIFGLRWLCKKFGISPSCCYNYKKDTKREHHKRLEHIFELIKYVYYNNNRVIGYRAMRIFIKRYGYELSNTTITNT